MARPRSDDRRGAIMAAAIRIIAAQGLGAPTAMIAREAGVSNGSLFTYFETKADLLNRLYVELKAEMVATAGDRLPANGEPRAQLLHLWSHWLRWAAADPDKRWTLAQLDVSDVITAESHRAVRDAFADIRALLERSREGGPLRDLPLEYVAALLSALAEATIDCTIRDPARADLYRAEGFGALWRMIT